MPIEHHIALDRAKKAAKTIARTGAMSHQQALDQEARNAGYRHWSDMQSACLPKALPATPSSLDQARSSALKINDWVSRTLRNAAEKALTKIPPSKNYKHVIRPLPMDARMAAEAIDPTGAPWEGDILQARCPLHEDTGKSLRIRGAGQNLHLHCSAGCAHSDLQDLLLTRICDETNAALTFMAENDRSKVISGSAFGSGGAGGCYVLDNGQRHNLNILAMRLLMDGYPVWKHGHMPRSVTTLERAMRIALAGRFPIKTIEPEDRAKGLWKFEITVGQRQDYHILLSRRQGEQPGLNACHEGEFSVDAAETFATPAAAIDRLLDLTRSFETLDPAENTKNEVRHAREIARNERLQGTVKGWGWWAGPNEDEFKYGPYKTKAEAISQGNGSCMENGEYFYVVQALIDPRYVDHPEGNPVLKHEMEFDTDKEEYVFYKTRGLKRCRAT